MKPPRRLRRLEILPYALIVALALFLRLRHLDTTGIWADQAFTLNTAMRWVNGGRIPLAANKSSIGIMNPPMIEYLYAAALRCWPDVLSVAVLTMLSGLLAIAAAGWAAWRTLGKRAAFWTMLVFAVNPWSVYYSQLIWNQTMIPVFSSLMLACLLGYFVVDRRPWLLVLGLSSAACMTQVHPSTVTQLLAMALICLVFWRRLKLWPLIVGGAVFVLLYVPFLLYEIGVGWEDVRTAWRLVGQAAPVTPASLLVSLDLLRAQGLLRSAAHVVTFDTLGTVVFAVAFAYACAVVVRGLWKGTDDRGTARRRDSMLILLLWIVVPLLFYLRSSHYLQIYYLIAQLPAPFILIGAALDGLDRDLGTLTSRLSSPPARRALQTAVRAGLYLPVVALLAWQTSFNLRFQDHRRDAVRDPAQIRHFRAAIRTSQRLLEAHPACTLVALSEGHTVETSQLSLLREFVSRERVLLADGRLALAVPAPCALYLDTQDARASTWLQRSAELMEEETLDVLDERWRFFELSAAAQDAAAVSGADPPLTEWENGLALVGYERGPAEPGRTLPVTLTWSIEEPVPDQVYHVGTYLLTNEDQVAVQSDGPGFDSIQWRAGDRFITWFDLTVPERPAPGDHRLAVAVYTWPAVERIGLRDGGNTAYLERVVLE